MCVCRLVLAVRGNCMRNIDFSWQLVGPYWHRLDGRRLELAADGPSTRLGGSPTRPDDLGETPRAASAGSTEAPWKVAPHHDRPKAQGHCISRSSQSPLWLGTASDLCVCAGTRLARRHWATSALTRACVHGRGPGPDLGRSSARSSSLGSIAACWYACHGSAGLRKHCYA